MDDVNLDRYFSRWYTRVVLPRLWPQYHYQSGAHETGWYFAELQNRNVIICTAMLKDGAIVFDDEKALKKLTEKDLAAYLAFVHETLDKYVGVDTEVLMRS